MYHDARIHECQVQAVLHLVHEFLSELFHVLFPIWFKFGVRYLHVLLLNICERAEVNRIRKGLTFLEGVNGITFTRVPWNILDFCLTVLRHGTREINLILVKEMPFLRTYCVKAEAEFSI